MGVPRVRQTAAGVMVLAAVLAACSEEDPTPDQRSPATAAPGSSAPATTQEPATLLPGERRPGESWPGESWKESPRGEWSTLDADLQAAGSSCVAVVQDGELVHEGYWNGGRTRRAGAHLLDHQVADLRPDGHGGGRRRAHVGRSGLRTGAAVARRCVGRGHGARPAGPGLGPRVE